MGLDPVTHRPRTDHLNLLSNLQQILAAANIVSSFTNPHEMINALRLQSDTTQLAKLNLMQNMLSLMGTTPASNIEQLNTMGSSYSMPDSVLYEVLGLNHSNHQNIYNGSIGSSSQDQPNFQNFEAPQQPAQASRYQHMNNGSRNSTCSESQNFDEQLGSTNATPTPSNSLPNLVSASPERSPAKQAEKVVNPKECSNNPSSTTFEMWGDFMDEDASDAYWKDFIE